MEGIIGFVPKGMTKLHRVTFLAVGKKSASTDKVELCTGSIRVVADSKRAKINEDTVFLARSTDSIRNVLQSVANSRWRMKLYRFDNIAALKQKAWNQAAI